MNPTAFENTVREFRGRLLAFTRRRVPDPDTAEDLVQDIFTKLYAAGPRIDPAQSVSAWLYRTARNTIIDHYRRSKPHAELPADLRAPEPEHTDADRRELAGCLSGLLHGLPERYREPLLAVEVRDLSLAQTAADLGLSLSGAKTRVQRGRNLLLQRLHGCCAPTYDRQGYVQEFQPTGCATTTRENEAKAAGQTNGCCG